MTNTQVDASFNSKPCKIKFKYECRADNIFLTIIEGKKILFECHSKDFKIIVKI